ncbi:MAG: hypothetical protein ACE5EZ_05410 [Thermodesulfobacteriota bacterium]
MESGKRKGFITGRVWAEHRGGWCNRVRGLSWKVRGKFQISI